MKNNTYYVGFILSLISDDCEVSIFRNNTELVTDTPKSEVNYTHYGRQYRRVWSNDGEPLKDSKTITIQVF